MIMNSGVHEYMYNMNAVTVYNIGNRYKVPVNVIITGQVLT